jgi:hypothetical protein
VIDAAVWSYDPYAPPYVIVTWTPAQPVYRGPNLPAATSFLLSGRLTQVGSCPSGQLAPTPNTTATPAGGYWKVGGVAIRAVVDIPANLVGRLVVVAVVRSKIFDCAPTSSTCSPQPVLVVTESSWSGP